MPSSDTSKSHKKKQKQKQHKNAVIPKGSQSSSPMLMGITPSQHWTSYHLGSTPYPLTISDSLGQDVSLAPIAKWTNASKCATHAVDAPFPGGSGAQQKDGVQPPLSQLLGWWEQEVVDEPYHGIGVVLGNFATTPNNCPVSASFLGSEGAVWGSLCREDWPGERKSLG